MTALKQQTLPEFFLGEYLIEAPSDSDNLHTFHGEKIQYSIYGSLKNPVNIVMGGISAGRHIAHTQSSNQDLIKGWWDKSVGYNKTIDTSTQCVIGIDYIPNQNLANKLFSNNSAVSTLDQANIVKYLLSKLGIKKLNSFVGSSYGGMIAMSFAAAYPDALEKLVVLCASDQANSRTTAFRSIQRSMIDLAAENKKDEAVSLARSLGMIVYRSHLEFEQRFDNTAEFKNNQWTFPVTDYIYNRGEALAKTFSPERFFLLSESCDLHTVKAEDIKCDTLLIGFDTDDIVKPKEIKNLASKISGQITLKIFDTIYGHDAFIVEQDRFAQLLQKHISIA